ncbi:hypothetical protein GCM10025857_04200 [Alicyclobacillus contaminans]|nr:hypothetical protein [Alicyclobacillus contaminans]GMA49063.1 hypothetical protein GCM10025857_04200 [Alicyclobacillus contaminans]
MKKQPELPDLIRDLEIMKSLNRALKRHREATPNSEPEKSTDVSDEIRA